eukprot:CAMPEP_0202379572 /NCGR_PEP_ID=MMETSP1127-20130417/24767_1 /ASSEMBLY_ACC=CAM_ASM_000462 /TAXON_ID=3047 /ORGANISM="Dunaliella tertiolecta, Strain CCMP1320" /LENGTH=192 /DNA_ID=CAMNT_0048978111 /DNA_START=25 /DNA_END=603 /DNA_ORIENTATION=+
MAQARMGQGMTPASPQGACCTSIPRLVHCQATLCPEQDEASSSGRDQEPAMMLPGLRNTSLIWDPPARHVHLHNTLQSTASFPVPSRGPTEFWQVTVPPKPLLDLLGSIQGSLSAAVAGLSAHVWAWPRLLMARNLRQEPEPFEGELDDDDFIEGEFEDLDDDFAADDELDLDLVDLDIDDLEEDSEPKIEQ